MPDRLDVLQRPQLLIGAGTLRVMQFAIVAMNEFDGLEKSAGCFALPDLAEAALAQRLDQAIARNRLRVGFLDQGVGRRTYWHDLRDPDEDRPSRPLHGDGRVSQSLRQ